MKAKLKKIKGSSCKGCIYFNLHILPDCQFPKCEPVNSKNTYIFVEDKPNIFVCFFKTLWSALTACEDLTEEDLQDPNFQQGHYRHKC